MQDAFKNPRFLSKAGKEQVASSDLQRLKPRQWLNDEVINFFGAMIMERSDSSGPSSSATVNGNGKPLMNGNGKPMNGNGVKNGRKGKAKAEPLKAHVFSTFFFSKLQDSGYDKGRLNKWTKKVSNAFGLGNDDLQRQTHLQIDVFSKDILLVPVNLGNSHWTCAAINLRLKRFEYYDSLGMEKPSVFQASIAIFFLLLAAVSHTMHLYSSYEHT